MERRLKTPIRRTLSPYVPRKPQPYLQLNSLLDETGAPIDHRLKVILSRGEYTHDSPLERSMRRAEMTVSIPRRMPWLSRVVSVAMPPDMMDEEPNKGVLRSLRYIQGVRDTKDLPRITYRHTERVHLTPVPRGSIGVEVGSGEDNVTCFRVGKAELVAAGLRLAVATTLLNPTFPEERIA